MRATVRNAVKVLIVEDETSLAEIMADVLIEEGHEVRIAPDGLAALEAVTAEAPDVIFLDLFLPHLDGAGVAAALRRDARTVAIPLVIISAMHRAEERAALIGTPFFIPKPFDLFELPHVLERVLASAA